MQRLRALFKAITDSGLVWPEEADFVAESGRVEWRNSGGGSDLILFRTHYTGLIEFFSARGDFEDLVAFVLMWLHDNVPADEQEMNVLESWSGEPVDEERSDISMILQFTEDIHYVPAGVGYTGPDKVTIRGADYKRGATAAVKAAALVDPITTANG